MGAVIMIRSSAVVAGGCLICGGRVWDCTVDGCKPAGQNLDGDVIHCKICNTAYIVETDGPRVGRAPGPAGDR